ncbi:MAG: nucleotidyltransferase domain-containing protein [Verrucomicrobiota bacterium]
MEKIADFCRRWKIARLEIFASVLRDDFRPDSDLDFLFTSGPDYHRWIQALSPGRGGCFCLTD